MFTVKYRVPFDDKKENKNGSTLGSNCEEPEEFQVQIIIVNCEKVLTIPYILKTISLNFS